MKDKRFVRLLLPILLISITVTFGIALCVALICYLACGNSGPIAVIIDTVKAGGAAGVTLVFMLVLLPIVTIALFIINILRVRRYNAIKSKRDEVIKEALEKEAEEIAAKQRVIDEANLMRASAKRFFALSAIDERHFFAKPAPTGKNLKELCEEFRYYAAGKLGLYYDISDIREFIAGMGVSHIIILQGISGTGKTSLAYAIGEFLGNPSTIIPVQPMWKERTDLLGYYNEFTKRYNETPLLEKIYEASYRSDITIAILDEMNIARVEYYFAEFLSLLEIPNAEARNLEIVSDSWQNDPKNLVNGKIRLSENIWFIGTINNDDSTFAISDKVYDRAMVMNFDRRAEQFEVPKKNYGVVHIGYDEFDAKIKAACEDYKITYRNLRRLKLLDKYLVDKFQITFGNRIMNQIKNYIAVYVSCGGVEIDALDDILSKKVIRKLEAKNAAYVRSESEELIKYMNELFGERNMTRCKQYIRRIAANS